MEYVLNKNRKSFLFLANPTVGHTKFLISLAEEAMRNGDEVLFMLPSVNNSIAKKLVGDPSLMIDSTLKNQAIPHVIIPISFAQAFLGLLLPHKKGMRETLFALKVLSAGARKYIKTIFNEISVKQPDVIVYDYTFFSAIAVAEKLGIPRVAIYHSGLPFFEYPVPPIGSTFKYGEYDANQSDEIHNVYKRIEDDLKSRYEKIINQSIRENFITKPNSKFLNIVTSIREAEYPRIHLDRNVMFAGGADGISNYERSDKEVFFEKMDNKLIYVSLGTIFNRDAEYFIEILRSMPMDGFDVLVSAGGSYRKLKKIAFCKNIHIEKFVPQTEVLSYTDVFVTHGGKNSVNEALSIGVPMIVFPIGGEQQYNAKLIEYLGVGINFNNSINDFNIQMMKSIEKLTSDKNVEISLKRLSDSYKNSTGVSSAYKEICRKL